MNVLVLGPQGSGKGTQAKRIKAMYGIPHIATGDMLREMRQLDTDLGRELKAVMDVGKLVDDAMMITLIRDRLSRGDTLGGFVLDGFPRTMAQAEALDDMLARAGTPLDRVVNLVAPTEQVVARLSTRLECPVCHRTYNPVGAAPRDGVHCDDHPAVALIHRVDDDVAKIRKRIEVFHAETAPLAEYYRRDGRLRTVEGIGELDAVFARVLDALSAAGPEAKEARA